MPDLSSYLRLNAWGHVSQVVCQDHMTVLRSCSKHKLGDMMRTEPWHSNVASKSCEVSAVSGPGKILQLLAGPWQGSMTAKHEDRNMSECWRKDWQNVQKGLRITFPNTENEIQLVLLHAVLRITLTNYTFVQLI